MILTEIERAQIAWFHYEEGLSISEVAYMFETTGLKALACISEFRTWYETV